MVRRARFALGALSFPPAPGVVRQ